MSTRATHEEPTQVQLTQVQLTQIVRGRFSGLAADLMCRMVSVLPGRNPLWNVRTAKAKFAEMLALVRKGDPQFLLREGDEEPVILLSFEAMHKLVERGVVGQSFTEGMAPFMRHTSTELTARDFGPRDRFTIPAASETVPARA